MTQYLTQVNEMPAQVVKHLTKAVRDFMWGGKSAPVSLGVLMAPREAGGKNLLDLKSRNEALQVMKLKSYLELDPNERASWAYLCDRRLEKILTKDSNADREAVICLPLQSCKANEHKLPKRHKSMLKCAKKHKVKFDTLSPSREVQGKLPLWHHLGEDRTQVQINNSAACVCLRENHLVK
ncbi:hypothetical protein C8R47DRAFT_999215, partial [Mycena vitilis]